MKRNRYKSLRLGDKKQLASKLLFTFLMIALFKLLSFIPAPFVNREVLSEMVKGMSILETAQLFSGRAITQLTLMATGVSSYISASIFVQFATYASKRLDEISKSSNGEKVMKKITMVLGVILSIITSLVFTIGFASQNPEVLTNHSTYVYIIIALVHAIGTLIAIAIGEAIDKKGYGNGVSLLITINIVSNIPSVLTVLWYTMHTDLSSAIAVILLTILMACIIIVVDSSEKKIPVIYSKVVARTNNHMRAGRQTLPLKVNASGVMPIIIASFVMQAVSAIITLVGSEKAKDLLATCMDPRNIYYGLITSILIVIFTFVYSKIIFNAGDVAESLQKNGGTLLGIRPGRDTRNYLQEVNKSLTRISAFYLLIVSLIPIYMTGVLRFTGIQSTSLMIIIGVSLDTIIKLGNEYSLGKMKL